MVDVLIVGAGPAGMTAAIYAVRYGLSAVVFEKMFVGGQVTTTAEIENYPGTERITGFDFAMSLEAQAVKLGVEIVRSGVNSLALEGPVKTVVTDDGEYTGKAVVIANGAERRKLGCPGEEEYSGRGVSYCASCDGALFKGKDVAIVGGGNTALEDALFLANLCRKVTLIHRRDTFSAMPVYQNAVKRQENIDCMMDSNITAIEGETTVKRLKIAHKDGNETTLDVDAVFIAIGNIPDNGLVKGILSLDPAGYIEAGEDCLTNAEGVYAAGDTRTKDLRQIVTATGDGAVAAFMAANYINQHN